MAYEIITTKRFEKEVKRCPSVVMTCRNLKQPLIFWQKKVICPQNTSLTFSMAIAIINGNVI